MNSHTSISKQKPCPLSTYASEVGLKAESECKTCPPGHYCVGFGLTKPSGPCNAGYFCPSGSIHPDEEDCAKGSYCPEGTAKPIECPAGEERNMPTDILAAWLTIIALNR